MSGNQACAKQEPDVRKLYEDEKVAEDYVQDRFQQAWSRLLHRTQVNCVNHLIAQSDFKRVLEVAPGPARLTAEIDGVRNGTLVEASAEMIEVARHNLEKAGKYDSWNLCHGNAFELNRLGKSFDFVFTFRFIRHFETQDRFRLYEQFHSVLEPGGTLCFDVVNDISRARVDAQEAKDDDQNSKELSVYDVTYSDASFRAEMDQAGFEVVAMHPTIRHMAAQSWVSHKIGPRIEALASILVSGLELIPSANPLEWVAVCRKRD